MKIGEIGAALVGVTFSIFRGLLDIVHDSLFNHPSEVIISQNASAISSNYSQGLLLLLAYIGAFIFAFKKRVLLPFCLGSAITGEIFALIWLVQQKHGWFNEAVLIIPAIPICFWAVIFVVQEQKNKVA